MSLSRTKTILLPVNINCIVMLALNTFFLCMLILLAYMRRILITFRFQISDFFIHALFQKFTTKRNYNTSQNNIKTTLNYINIKGKMCAVTKGD